MINRVVLVGRITKDPDVRTTSSGYVARFTLAVNRPFSKDAEKSADFVSCVAFNKTAELMEKYVKKGALLGVDGRINTGSYEKDGRTVYTTDVICESIQFLEPKADTLPSNDIQNEYQKESSRLEVEDDLPF